LFGFPKPVADGKDPIGLVVAPNGGLYGTASSGGKGGAGALFELQPPSAAGEPWSETVLHMFGKQLDGFSPSGLVTGKNGEIYVVTAYGGGANYGAVFELSPPGTADGPWTESVLHSFSTGADGDGSVPYGNLALGADGSLYGTTTLGGSACAGGGCGTVFQLVPPVSPGDPWTETVIYSFTGGSDGNYPYSGVTMGSDGKLYGVAPFGGSANNAVCNGGCGAVFSLSPQPAGGWAEQTLLEFGGRNGAFPSAALLLDTQGRLYGVTAGGGDTKHCGSGCGTVFELIPPAHGKSSWTEKVLLKCAENRGPRFPVAIALGPNGSLYVTGSRAEGASGGTRRIISVRWRLEGNRGISLPGPPALHRGGAGGISGRRCERRAVWDYNRQQSPGPPGGGTSSRLRLS